MKLILFVVTILLAGKQSLLQQANLKTISISKGHENKFNIKITSKEEKKYKHFNEILNLNDMNLSIIKNDIIKSDAIRDVSLANNFLKKIPHNILDHVTYLLYLNLSQNNINLYEDNKIVHPNLRLLDLSYQRMSNVIIPETSEVETLEETEDIYKRLIFNSSRIRLPNLEYLNLCGNDISAISWDFNLSFPKLTCLDLSNINAVELEPNFFNKISTSLRVLHFENNYLRNFTLQDVTGITSLYLDGNIFEMLFIKSSKLRILSLSNCTKHLTKGSFETPYLEQLDLSRNDFGNHVDVTIHFERFPSLKVLLLDYNKLSYVPIVTNLQWLNELSLCYNIIKVIKPNAFRYLTSLTKLSLKGNKIERIEKENFSGLEKLEYLDLSENQLSHLPIDWASSLENLQHLNVITNQFASISEMGIYSIISLQYLFVRNNTFDKITTLEIDPLPDFVTIYL